MFRAILDLTDVGQIDNRRTKNRQPPGCAYLFSESWKIPEKTDEMAEKSDFPGKNWISLDVANLKEEQDLTAVRIVQADTIVLRGCKGPEDVEKASVLLTVSEIDYGLNHPVTNIIASIADTASAVQSLSKWTFLPERLTAMLFDPAALARSMGLSSPFDSHGQRLPLLDTAAHLALFAAHALACPIYDATLWDHHSNPSKQYFWAQEMGFAGAVTRNPNHVDLISAIFA